MTLSERIKLRREELGLSQEALALALGYKHRSSITEIEKGRNEMPLKKVEAFAKVLKVTPEWLMGIEDKISNNDFIADFVVNAQNNDKLVQIAKLLNECNDKQLSLVEMYLQTLTKNL